MMTPERIHELNKVCAEVCGKEVYWEEHGKKWCLESDYFTEWSPCTDASQMAQVKQALREKGYGWATAWDQEDQVFRALIQPSRGARVIIEKAHASSELMAFALAVEAMRKEGRC